MSVDDAKTAQNIADEALAQDEFEDLSGWKPHFDKWRSEGLL